MSHLSAEDQARLEALTAPKGERYSADAQNQRGLERLRAWTRALFKREDHRRWRDSKTKILGFLVVCAASFALWFFFPRPQLSGGVDGPVLSIGSSSPAPTDQARADTVNSANTRPAQNPSALEAIAPPKLPAPSLERSPSAVQSAPTTVNPSALPEDPFQPGTRLPDPIPTTTRAVSIPAPSLPSVGLIDAPPSRDAFAALPASPPRTAQMVAPPPVPLAQRTPFTQRTPKPLMDRTDSKRANVEAQALSDTTGWTSGTLEVATTPASAAEPTGVAAPRAERNESAALPLLSAQDSASDTTPLGQAGVLFDQSATTQTAASTSDTAPSSAQASPSPYPPGSRLEGKLAVGVIVLPGRESPVVVALADGAIAFGKAALTETMRVQIALLEVARDGRSTTVNGSALGADGFTGVTGEVREDGPDAVGKLWNAALSGVSSYVQGLANAGTTTLGNGVTTITNGAPDLGWSLVGALAQAFLPQQSQQSQTIRYVVLQPGASFQVLFMPSR